MSTSLDSAVHSLDINAALTIIPGTTSENCVANLDALIVKDMWRPHQIALLANNSEGWPLSPLMQLDLYGEEEPTPSDKEKKIRALHAPLQMLLAGKESQQYADVAEAILKLKDNSAVPSQPGKKLLDVSHDEQDIMVNFTLGETSIGQELGISPSPLYKHGPNRFRRLQRLELVSQLLEAELQIRAESSDPGHLVTKALYVRRTTVKSWRNLHSQPTTPIPIMTDKSNPTLNHSNPYLSLFFAFVVVLEFVVTVVFKLDRVDISSNLCLLAQFTAFVCQIWVFTIFTGAFFFGNLVLPGKRYIMPDVLAWWYPAFSRKEIVVLLERDIFYRENIANDMMEEGLASSKAAAALYEPWLFVVNGAIYCRQPGTPIIAGALQQLLLPLTYLVAAILIITGLFLVLPLALDISMFSRDFKAEIHNNKAMKKIRAETDLVGDRKTGGDI
ncbi:hypothetical protein C8J56DRAFT_1156582 [Mycena floridula]|nr:hypothetical protein C8J56DRAFT_1156582 [Mycena floridula]